MSYDPLDRNLQQLQINQTQIGRAQFNLRREELKIQRAQQQLPGAIDATKKQLQKVRRYKAQVRERAKQEAGQRKTVAKQVLGQKAKIRKAAISLAKQGAEQHSKIKQYRRETHELMLARLDHNLFVFNDLKNRWWMNALVGLQLSEYKVGDAIIKATGMFQKALMGGPVGIGVRWRKGWGNAIYGTDAFGPRKKQTPVISESEIFPKLAKLSDGFAKQYAKLDDAERDLRYKVAEQKGKIERASKDLDQQAGKAERQITAALKKRAGQLASLDSDEKRVLKHLTGLKQRGSQIDQAAGQVQNRKAYLAGKAAQVARAKRATVAEKRRRDALRARLEAAWEVFQKADSKTKKAMIKKFPRWFLREKMSNGRR